LALLITTGSNSTPQSRWSRKSISGPSSQQGFNVLQWGAPFLFKLHAPRNFVVGGGFFTRFLRLPVSLAWETFREANGARSLDEVRIRIGKYRKRPIGPTEDPVIGCILLEEPFFFEEAAWIPSPADFKGPTQTGKSYDMESGTGLMLWREVTARLSVSVARTSARAPGPATIAAQESARYGTPTISYTSIGTGIFPAAGDRCLQLSLCDDLRANAARP